MQDVFLLIHFFCSFSLLAQRKRTKRKGLFGPHKCHFCLWQNQFKLPLIFFFNGQLESPFFICVCFANWFLVVMLQAEKPFSKNYFLKFQQLNL
ncbi:MAG: hypothetical protein CFE24_08380 [Flavobacterium sp. BFFFF2]|nr:MAG: hypothetical protein CFE24_08380 [Flavobacterium sp. BFFFF2]